MPDVSRSCWGAEALRQQLQPLWPGLSVEILPVVDSTNSRLLRSAADRQPRLLVAEQQTHGRGRQGREWHASAGASLTFSLALPMAPLSWSGLSLAVGLALAEALDPAAVPEAGWRPRIGLKWPNDLWLWEGPGRGRKMAGILIETVSAGEGRMCVVGVGLNIAPQPASGPSAGAACLQEIDASATAARALATVVGPLALALRRFERHGFSALAPAYARRDLLQGQQVRTQSAGANPPGLAALHGLAEGVDAQGALCVRVATGLHRLVSGEVSVRFCDEAPPGWPDAAGRQGDPPC